jgi:hypothetical protein
VSNKKLSSFLITAFLALIISTFLFGTLSYSETNRIPDADWPVTRHPAEATLKAKTETLASLVKKIESRGLDASYARSALVLARDFVVYANEDEKNGRPGRAAYVRGYLDEALDNAIGEAQALIRNPKLNRPVPRPPLRNIAIRNGAFFAGGTEVMFGGMGHFGKVRADIPKFSDYGFNLIQIEIGPNSVVTGPDYDDIKTDAIKNDIIKNLDYAGQHGVMINLLLSPHYFPDWAMKKYPELKECGRGFIQYCVSDPNARRVLRRFLQTLIPMVKDNPALQSYTLANEPNFYEHGAAGTRGFQIWLQKKYGDISALNRAWHKKYKSFDKIKVNEDLFSLNAPVRYDWATYHDKICTEFFFWMKSVIRTMDKKTPVHIKFMDDMFASEETLWGIDREALEKFTEISGNDSTTRYPGEIGFAMNDRQNGAFYDFMKSVQPRKPIQNSETHIIADDVSRFYPENYIKAAMWLQYLRGMAASTMWVWERSDDPSLGNNILSRPNCVAATARATLDVRRLAPYVTAIANSIQDSPVSIYYSQTTRILQHDFLEKWEVAYDLARYTGYPVHFVTDSALAAGLDPRRVRMLIVPEYIFTTDELYVMINDFIKRGGHVAAIGNCFKMNERERARSTIEWEKLFCDSKQPKKNCVAILPAAAKTTPEENLALLLRAAYKDIGTPQPELQVTDTVGKPVFGVEFRSAKYKGKNVAYIFNSLDHAVTVRLGAKNRKWHETKDLISSRPIARKLVLDPMDIVLFTF